jgi:putative flippase GtrA
MKKINTVQFFKYLVAGGISFALDFFSFYFGLSVLGLSIINANMLGMLTGFISGFLLYQYWAFATRRFVLPAFLYMTILFVFNIFLVNYLIDILVGVLQLRAELAKIILQVSVVIWNFFIYKFFIFKRDRHEH